MSTAHARRAEEACRPCRDAHAAAQASRSDQATSRATAAREQAKNRADERFCNRHDNGAGAWLPADEFDFKNKQRGTLRSWCRDCFKQYQRDRYIRVGARSVTIELLEGDICLGDRCTGCGKPFRVGERVTGEHLHHDRCTP